MAHVRSYQLVSRFAGKNTISLGLGCVGSGGIVLAVEVALRITARPTHGQTLSLYLVCSGICDIYPSFIAFCGLNPVCGQ